VIRVVLDTNVVISSLLSSSGPPAQIRRALSQGDLVACLSSELFQEYADVIRRERFTRMFGGMWPVLANQFLHELTGCCEWVTEPLKIEPVIEQDPDDDIVLATALSASAKFIITGDNHLLALVRYRGIEIVTPSDFCRHPPHSD